MVGESQFDRWRQDIVSNLKKAGEALAIDDEKRYQLATLAMDVTAKVMIAERTGMLALALNRNDEVLATVIDRARTGEQIVERLIKTLESDEVDLPEEAKISISLAEDWLEPEGPVAFTPPPQST